MGRLGIGLFGLVTLQINKNTGQTYAGALCNQTRPFWCGEALKAVSKGFLAHLQMEPGPRSSAWRCLL